MHLSPAELVLKYAGKSTFDIDIQTLAQQLRGLQIARNKLPTWFTTVDVIFPPKKALEQCTSELLAKYKASLISGDEGLDLSGGFGVDSYFFAQKFRQWHYFERDVTLAQIADHNFKMLASENICCHPEDGVAQFPAMNRDVDMLYVDPDRRSKHQQKRFTIHDAEPNVQEHFRAWLRHAKMVMVKLSPMLDIAEAVKAFAPHISRLHILAHRQDCKELLFTIDRQAHTDFPVSAVHFLADGSKQEWTFQYEAAKAVTAPVSAVKTYVYEPNVAIMKSGAVNVLCREFSLEKLHPNTHLFTHDQHLPHFPGRVFKVVNAQFKKADIVVRNFPESEKTLRKTRQFQPGNGVDFCLAFTDIEKPKVVFAQKLQ